MQKFNVIEQDMCYVWYGPVNVSIIAQEHCGGLQNGPGTSMNK